MIFTAVVVELLAELRIGFYDQNGLVLGRFHTVSQPLCRPRLSRHFRQE
jgi:hypothetical protein